jgi:hypothetical protein
MWANDFILMGEWGVVELPFYPDGSMGSGGVAMVAVYDHHCLCVRRVSHPECLTSSNSIKIRGPRLVLLLPPPSFVLDTGMFDDPREVHQLTEIQ